jgi:hypothetical protein
MADEEITNVGMADSEFLDNADGMLILNTGTME